MNDQASWLDNNEQHLAATLRWIRLRLERLTSTPAEPVKEYTQSSNSWFKRNKTEEKKQLPPPSLAPSEETIELARQEILKLESHEPAPSLILLAKQLSLSNFEQSVLALCAAMELDVRVAELCAKAQGDTQTGSPTFGLAFTLFEEPDWAALAPHSPLRYWRLLEINQPGARTLTGAYLSADERIVNYLKGLNYLDDRLTPLFDQGLSDTANSEVASTLPASQQKVVDAIIKRLMSTNTIQNASIIELLGRDSTTKRLIASQVCLALGLSLQRISIKTIPAQTGDFETFTRLWQRESLLMPLALYIDCSDAGEGEKPILKRFLNRSNGVVFVDSDTAKGAQADNRFSIEVNKPTPQEQELLWSAALTDQAGDQPQRLAEQFSFSSTEIMRLAQIFRQENDVIEVGEDQQARPRESGQTVWEACRVSARSGMEQLAQRIDVKANWKQLILPDEQNTLLRQLTDQVAQRNRVYEDWGFRKQINRGMGISALFSGESGTGKTMAAEVIANELELDLYRIDLSAVISKYIGETEKNLKELFDTAEDSGAILFFDEADALFGKRSEVKDSHDRYANIEINYLLQRMESYRGLAILATNLKSSLDKAFMRRLRFIVDFPFPAAEQRKAIWLSVFPSDTPIDRQLDYARLSRLNLTGGSIFNIALNTAFLAAQEGTPVSMPLLLNAARAEFKKLERPAKESDFRWLDTAGAS